MNFEEITQIEEIENEDVYNLEVPFFHNFIANGIVVHNCADACRYLVKTLRLVKRDKYLR